MQKRISHQQKHLLKRLIVGWIALYPTLLVVLSLLGNVTHSMTMPMATLVEVVVIVPVTQLVSYPIAGKIFAGWMAR